MSDLRAWHVGQTRPTVKTIVVRFPVVVTVEWPEGIPYSDEEAVDVAQCVVTQRCERDVGRSTGRIVWARCYAEVMSAEAEVEDA
jgi:hypothetical protein